jgi:hypothetical protein
MVCIITNLGEKVSFTIAPQNPKVNYFFYDHINLTIHWVSGKLWRMLNLMHAIGILRILWCFICERRIGLVR